MPDDSVSARRAPVTGRVSVRNINTVLRSVAKFVADARAVLADGSDRTLILNQGESLPLSLELTLRTIAVQDYVSKHEPGAEQVDGHIISPLYFILMTAMLKQFVRRRSYRARVRKMDQFELRVTGHAVPSEGLFAALMGLVEERIPEWKTKSTSESTGA